MLEGHGWGGSRDTDENSASSEQTGNVGLGPLRRAGFNVLTWDSRGFGNSGGTVEVDSPGRRGARRQRADRLARPAARGAARQAGRPARGHDRRLLRRRHRARDRAARQAHRRDRADHRLALAAHLALQGGHRQGRLVVRRSTPPASPGSQEPARPAHHLGVHHRRGTGHAVAPTTARGSTRAGRATRSSDITIPTLLVKGTADTLFTLHEAIENYAILRGQRRADEDDVVLRRPRRLPDRLGPGRAHRGRRDRLAEALPGGRHVGRHRAALRVAGRRRRLALGRRLPAARRRAARGHRLGHARANPADAASGTPITAGLAANARQRRRPAAAGAHAAARRAEADAHLLRHRHGGGTTSSPSSSTQRAAWWWATRPRRSRSRSTGSRTRVTRSLEAIAAAAPRARATRCRSPAARRSTARCARRRR